MMRRLKTVLTNLPAYLKAFGWKGLLYDPHLDDSGDMAEGLRLSRKLMLDILEAGLPIASELLQPLATGYFGAQLGDIVEGDVVTVGYTYSGEWRWEIALEPAIPDRLTLTMSNVVPASAATDEIPAGAYAAMSADLRRLV